MRRPALLLLVAAVLAATVAAGTASAASTVQTNETVVTAQLEGTTATNLTIPLGISGSVRSIVATDLGVPERSVRVSPANGTVEVRHRGVSASALRAALEETDLNAATATIRDGVTATTQAETVRGIRERLDGANLSGQVQPVTTENGTRGVVIRSSASRSAIRETVTFEGAVSLVAHFPTEQDGEGYREETLLTNSDFTSVGAAQSPTAGQPNPFVAVSIREAAARNFSTQLVEAGFTSEAGIGNCPTDTAVSSPDTADGYCLYTVFDGEVIYAAQMSAGLAPMLENGEFSEDPRFIITAQNMSEARRLSLGLRAGALPAPLDFDALPESAIEDSGSGSENGSATETATTVTTTGGGPGFTAGTAVLALLSALATLVTGRHRP